MGAALRGACGAAVSARGWGRPGGRRAVLRHRARGWAFPFPWEGSCRAGQSAAAARSGAVMGRIEPLIAGSTVSSLACPRGSPAHSAPVAAAAGRLSPAVPSGAEGRTGTPVASVWVFRKSLKGLLVFSCVCIIP